MNLIEVNTTRWGLKMNSSEPFDVYDIAILSSLGVDPRMTTVKLSEQVHLSRTAIARRINILRDRGAFLNIPELISYQALGFDIDATIEIAMPSNGVARVQEELLQLPEILSVSTTTGYGHLVVRAITVDMAHFRRLISGFQQYGDVTTNIVMSTRRSQMSLIDRLAAIRSNALAAVETQRAV